MFPSDYVYIEKSVKVFIMDPIIALDDSSIDLPIDLETDDNVAIEPEFPDESIDALIQRATLQMSDVRSKMEKTSAAPLLAITVRATQEMEAAIQNVAPIDVLNVTDDDVIFVEEQQSTVINLCSPDKSPRTSRFLLNQNKGKPTGTTASVPHTDDDSSANSVMCAVCMESSVGRQPHTTKCGHIFCGTCIKEAVRITKKCPLCNKQLSVKNLMPVFI